MKILVAPNAFKGSLTAADAAHIISRAVLDVIPDAQILQIPLADGGSGTLDTLIETTLGDFVEEECTNATGERIVAPFGILGQSGFEARTGVIEIAQCCGLKDIPLRKRNPLVATTYGAGELMIHAQQEGCLYFIIGLGDTGTHDCGAGIAQAVGIRLFDNNGKSIGRGGAELLKLASIDLSVMNRAIAAIKVIAACDVTNPLLGKNNSARVYAPQKGADSDALKILEDASGNFARVVKKELGKDIGKTEGSGAAGGAGAGLAAFFDAELRPGAELVLECVHFDEKCLDADLVITGEGAIDAQTTNGKTISVVCKHAQKLRVPVIAFAGITDESDHRLRKEIGLAKMYCITPDTATEDEAMRHARNFLEERVKQVFMTENILANLTNTSLQQ